MCEESACLVPSLENPQNGSSSSGFRVVSNRGSSGTTSNSGDALVGFHEDAISQAAAGKAQLLLCIALGFAVIADASELSLLGYILPAAELQLCLDDHRREWLVSITHLALGIGALCWGFLGDKVGRKRGLITALAVGGLFSTVSTVMPTYGTFMTARFGSGLGIAGVMPLAFSYLAETCPRATRTRYMSLLYSFWPAGALLTSAIAHLTLPSNGAEIVSDNKEHWSSWHKFLLLNILPIVIGSIFISTMSESPRYLLEAAREMEALEVYQKLHKMNKSRTQYGLTELELPGRSAYRERPNNSSRNALRIMYDTLKETFQRLLSPSYFESTVTLLLCHFLMSVLYMGISTYSTLVIKDINDAQFTELKKHVINENYTGTVFNSTIENVQYTGTVFKNVTFRHMEFSHVEFFDCIFEGAEFSNVKSSITYFENSTIKDCRFFDTDLSERHFINCNMMNNTFVSLLSSCMTNFDYNIYLEDLFQETVSWASPMLLALCLTGFLLEATKRPAVLIVMFVLIFLTSIGIFFLTNFTAVLIVCGILKVLMICVLNVITVVTIEAFPCNLRCSAHGILCSVYHFTTLFAISLYNYLSQVSVIASGVTTMTFALIGIPLAGKLQDNSKILL